MYNKTNWIDGVTPVDAAHLNRLEDAMYSMDSQLEDVVTYQSVGAASDTFSLDLSKGYNFAIETTDTASKTISFINPPATANLIINVTIRLKATNVPQDLTYPVNTLWQDGLEPAPNTGKQYLLLFTSYDNGNTWLASYVGEW